MDFRKLLTIILGVPPTATDAEIEAATKRFSMRASELTAAPTPVHTTQTDREALTMTGMEDAVDHACAMLDLLGAFLADLERGGDQHHPEPPWISHIRIAANKANWQLAEQYETCCGAVFRLKSRLRETHGQTA